MTEPRPAWMDPPPPPDGRIQLPFGRYYGMCHYCDAWTASHFDRRSRHYVCAHCAANRPGCVPADPPRGEPPMRPNLARLAAVAAIGALALLGSLAPSPAQTPSTQPPYNTDLGVIITNSARAPGTVTSSQQDNLDGVGLACTIVQSAASGNPTIALTIQGYDAASATYYDLATTGTVDPTTSTPITLMTKPGIIAADAVSPNIAKSIAVPRKWRLSQVLAGASTTMTGTVGCNKLR